MDFQEVKSDVKLLLSNQGLIKTQVEKTNGRVTFLEKMFWTFIGGGALFIFIFHEKIIKILVGA